MYLKLQARGLHFGEYEGDMRLKFFAMHIVVNLANSYLTNIFLCQVLGISESYPFMTY